MGFILGNVDIIYIGAIQSLIHRMNKSGEEY